MCQINLNIWEFNEQHLEWPWWTLFGCKTLIKLPWRSKSDMRWLGGLLTSWSLTSGYNLDDWTKRLSSSTTAWSHFSREKTKFLGYFNWPGSPIWFINICHPGCSANSEVLEKRETIEVGTGQEFYNYQILSTWMSNQVFSGLCSCRHTMTLKILEKSPIRIKL